MASTTIRAIGACLCWLVICGGESPLSGQTSPLAPISDPIRIGPYCGIDCIYAAAQHFGRPVSYVDLVDSRFVGSRQGSNLSELASAARVAGMSAAPKVGLSIGDLKTLEVPSVLLLSRHRDAASFNHWVLVVHADHHQVEVLEAPGRSETMSYAQLLAQWDGVGLVIYSDDDSKSAAERRAAGKNWFVALFVTACAVIAYVNRKRLPGYLTTLDPRLKTAAVRAAGMVGAAVGAAVLWHVLSTTGFYRNADAVSIVNSRFFTRILPEVGIEQMNDLIAGGAIVVDSRFAKDFRAGHLPSALNLPVDASPTTVQAFARRLPRNKAVVIYCQSDQCEFDEYVGSQLIFAGVEEVYSFQGGWREWKAVKLSGSDGNGNQGNGP